jgi:hypothetical protein
MFHESLKPESRYNFINIAFRECIGRPMSRVRLP